MPIDDVIEIDNALAQFLSKAIKSMPEIIAGATPETFMTMADKQNAQKRWC